MCDRESHLESGWECAIFETCRMKVVFRKILNAWCRMFSSPHKDVNRSRLVGMYLSRTNSKSALSTEFLQTRQRRNGKFSINRERV